MREALENGNLVREPPNGLHADGMLNDHFAAVCERPSQHSCIVVAVDQFVCVSSILRADSIYAFVRHGSPYGNLSNGRGIGRDKALLSALTRIPYRPGNWPVEAQ